MRLENWGRAPSCMPDGPVAPGMPILPRYYAGGTFFFAVSRLQVDEEGAMEKGRAAVFVGPRHFEMTELPPVPVGPGGIRVRILAGGICGSGLHFWILW